MGFEVCCSLIRVSRMHLRDVMRVALKIKQMSTAVQSKTFNVAQTFALENENRKQKKKENKKKVEYAPSC